MAKAPKDIPTEDGQRVMLRGRGHLGTVTKIDKTWVWVKWDEAGHGAEIHHAFELARVPVPGQASPDRGTQSP